MSLRDSIRAVVLVAVFAALQPSANAQEPQSTDAEETPSLSTEDVLGEPAAVGASSTAPSATMVLDRLGRELVDHGVPTNTVSAARARIDAGYEIAATVRFDVASDGKPSNFAQVGSTGFPDLDRFVASSIVKEASPAPMLAGFTDVHVTMGVSRAGMRFHATGLAPSVEIATELEAFAARLRDQASSPSSGVRDVSVLRNGNALTVGFTIAFAELQAPER